MTDRLQYNPPTEENERATLTVEGKDLPIVAVVTLTILQDDQGHLAAIEVDTAQDGPDLNKASVAQLFEDSAKAIREGQGFGGGVLA